MKVYIIRGYYEHEGYGSHAKAFANEEKAQAFKKELDIWIKQGPEFPDSFDYEEDKKLWDEFDCVYEQWSKQYDGFQHADGFIVEILNVEE